jgi:hypothetical protein
MREVVGIVVLAGLLAGCARSGKVADRCEEQSRALEDCGFEPFEDVCAEMRGKKLSASKADELLCRMDCQIEASSEDLAENACSYFSVVRECEEACFDLSETHFVIPSPVPCAE